MNDEEIILVEYFKISPNRVKVLKSFKGDILRPTQVADRTQLSKPTVSKVLKQLNEKDFIHLLNPDSYVPRLYRLTSKGEEMLKLI